ncbi:hypothetical protein ALI22I_01610 [Saccharothrix sp. ALI-22-I]|nr:hypothetical protein ALI22I_01610 [Saccharothrix sp. ALI-22-I]
MHRQVAVAPNVVLRASTSISAVLLHPQRQKAMSEGASTPNTRCRLERPEAVVGKERDVV